MKVTADLEGCW